MRKFSVRVNPEESKRLQEWAFKNGYKWRAGEKTIMYYNMPFLDFNYTLNYTISYHEYLEWHENELKDGAFEELSFSEAWDEIGKGNKKEDIIDREELKEETMNITPFIKELARKVYPGILDIHKRDRLEKQLTENANDINSALTEEMVMEKSEKIMAILAEIKKDKKDD